MAEAAVSLNLRSLGALLKPLEKGNAASVRLFPGDRPDRQPVHTVYGGAHLFKSDAAKKLGALALKNFHENASDFVEFAKALGLPGAAGLPEDAKEQAALKAKVLSAAAARKEHHAAWLAHTVYERVEEKLKREAVEDFRIDFEDGYGHRSDKEEDGHAAAAAEEVALGLHNKTLPPFIGIRIKQLSKELHPRSLRTLDIFITTLAKRTKGHLPPGFVVTLPKITAPEQVSTLAKILGSLETKLKLSPRALKFELMIETPQSIFDGRGGLALPRLLALGGGRITGAHFGTYDYTASMNITAAHQVMDHPVCDFAKHVMQVSLAGTGVHLSDGATNIMPVGPHKAGGDSGPLSPKQLKENRAVVHGAWKTMYGHVRHSLVGGFYQGWDLHPAQFPVRYGAVYAYFLEGLEPASVRLKNFIQKAAQATLVGDVFDDAATGQGLLNYFIRAMNCGAIGEEEVLATGLTLGEIRTRSFLKILEGRKAKA